MGAWEKFKVNDLSEEVRAVSLVSGFVPKNK